MDLSASPSKSLIHAILELPAELRRMVFQAILPSTLRLEYTEGCWGTRWTSEAFQANAWARSKDRPRKQKGPSIRLKSELGFFHPSQHVINKAWYAVVVDHIQSTTVWDLGDAGECYNYVMAQRKPQQQVFYRSLNSVRNMVVHVRMPNGKRKQAPVLGEKDKASILISAQLAISIVRIHFPDLGYCVDQYLQKWALVIGKWDLFWMSAEGTSANARRIVKIACSAAEYNTKQVQGFVEHVNNYAGGTEEHRRVRWIQTGVCRYQGPIGDIVVERR